MILIREINVVLCRMTSFQAIWMGTKIYISLSAMFLFKRQIWRERMTCGKCGSKKGEAKKEEKKKKATKKK